MSNVRNERLYNIWTCMKMRCLNKNNPRYHRYGGRGIRVADCWLHDYQSFKKWALSNGYGEGMSIERIDNDGNYCPENCKWIPQSQQSKNRTMNIAVSYRGETMCLSDMCRKYDVYNHYGTIRDRILKKHMSFEEAINTPVKSIHDNDITGKRYGRLTVLHFSRFYKRCSYWLCKCDCGMIKEIRKDYLGRVLSCRCLKREQDKINLRHEINRD